MPGITPIRPFQGRALLGARFPGALPPATISIPCGDQGRTVPTGFSAASKAPPFQNRGEKSRLGFTSERQRDKREGSDNGVREAPWRAIEGLWPAKAHESPELRG